MTFSLSMHLHAVAIKVRNWGALLVLVLELVRMLELELAPVLMLMLVLTPNRVVGIKAPSITDSFAMKAVRPSTHRVPVLSSAARPCLLLDLGFPLVFFPLALLFSRGGLALALLQLKRRLQSRDLLELRL